MIQIKSKHKQSLKHFTGKQTMGANIYYRHQVDVSKLCKDFKWQNEQPQFEQRRLFILAEETNTLSTSEEV